MSTKKKGVRDEQTKLAKTVEQGKIITKRSHRKLTWPERIAQAKKVGHFTADDEMRACDWSSCAVGENANKLGRQFGRVGGSLLGDFTLLNRGDKSLAKVEDQLHELGLQFSEQVSRGSEFNPLSDVSAADPSYIPLAAATYKKIVKLSVKQDAILDAIRRAKEAERFEPRA